MSKMDYSIKYCYTNHHAKMMMKYPPSKRFFLLYQSKANLMDLIRILITFVDRKCNQGQLLLPSKKKHMFTIRWIWHSISNLKFLCSMYLFRSSRTNVLGETMGFFFGFLGRVQSHCIEDVQGGVSSRARHNWLWVFNLFWAQKRYNKFINIMQLFSTNPTVFKIFFLCKWKH